MTHAFGDPNATSSNIHIVPAEKNYDKGVDLGKYILPGLPMPPP